MKVLKNNNIDQPQKIECYYCNSILEFSYETDARKPDDDSECYIVCPCCNKRIKLFGIEFNDEFDSDNEYDEDGEKVLTVNNIVYPDDFYDYTDAVKVDHETTNKWIKECLQSLREQDDRFGFACRMSGDTLVIAKGYEEYIDVYVCKNVWDATMDR